jgi:hypothetical protein
MTDSVADAHAHVLRLVSVVRMATVLEELILKSNVLCFMFTLGNVCLIKRFIPGSRNSLRGIQKLQMMPDQVWKWGRQESKVFSAVSFDTLVKQWDKCINVGGGYVEK